MSHPLTPKGFKLRETIAEAGYEVTPDQLAESLADADDRIDTTFQAVPDQRRSVALSGGFLDLGRCLIAPFKSQLESVDQIPASGHIAHLRGVWIDDHERSRHVPTISAT